MKRGYLLCAVILCLLLPAGLHAQVTPWLEWTFLPDTVMDEIIGEVSGENAWHMIMETGGYDKDRPASEYDSLFHETVFFLEKMKEYGLPGAALERFPGGETWDAVKGELWEISPMRQKLASYRDMAAMLASGSRTTDLEADLVWVGSGSKEEIRGKNIKGKIAVTEGYTGYVHSVACLDSGAAGIISMNSPRPYFDPLALPWGRVSGDPEKKLDAKFAFQIPPREGEFLKKRLLAHDTIRVRATVVAETRKYDLQDLTCYIPGTDTGAGEIIFSAHLFEGYVKQGGNDDISGCAAILEIARTLNTLIREGRIPAPRRAIRFLWGPEFSGTGPWVKAHKDLMRKTLCNINLDMVGEWLSKNKSFMCLHRTSYGNPHYVNDVVENYYRFVGEGNRDRIQNRGSSYVVPKRIVAPTGADEPFYYSIETHFGASDHEVFNDWAVRVPGVMMIAWPDQWYHTSGDHVDKADPTQLKRAAVIGAASAYTIACAGDGMAVRIAAEITSNAAGRLGHQYARGLQELNRATVGSFSEAYKTALNFIAAALENEKNTLATLLQIAEDKKMVAEYIGSCQRTVDQMGRAQLAALTTHMEALADLYRIRPASVRLSDPEKKASGILPVPTGRVMLNGYGGYWEFINNVPDSVKRKYPYDEENIGNASEFRLLIDGRRNVLEAKNMLDAQQRHPSRLQDIMNYLEILRAAGLIDMKR